MSKLLQLSIGAVLGGDFRIEELLGTGGMGAVYLALQLSTGRRRAVKVMHPQLVPDDKLRERFVREARVGALIESDHVVQVVGAGIDDDTDIPWLAMELLEGEDLADFMQHHRFFTPRQLTELLDQLCHALGAAHRVGVVHRDIKPENIFVTKARSTGAPRVIKVLDFGIAKVAADAQTTVTAALGSPAWMAPEQTDPRAKITPATDVWAIGLLAFWLLTGRSYWTAAADRHSSVHAMMKEILFEPLAPASQRARALGTGRHLPPGFDGWFRRCVIREPAARFADAAAAYAAFLALLSAGGDWQPPPESAPLSFARGSTLLSDFPPPRDSTDLAALATLPAGDTADEVASSAPTIAIAADDEESRAPTVALGDDEESRVPAGAVTGDTELSAAAPGDEAAEPEPPPPARRSAELSAQAAQERARRRRWEIAAAGLFVALLVGLRAWYGSSGGEDPVAAEAPSARALPPASQAAAVAAVAPGPSAGAGEPATEPTASAAASSRAAAGSAAAETPPAPATAQAASSAPAASAPPTGSAVATAGASATGVPAAAASASASASTAAAPRPFDTNSAKLRLERQARIAHLSCRGHRHGPLAYTATVLFNPTGEVAEVSLMPRYPASAAYFCIRNILRRTQVPPFDGPPQSLSVGITL